MKIAFIVNSDIENRAGYFNAVHSRIKQLAIDESDKKIFTIRYYDNKLLSLLRSLASKKKVSAKRESFFEYDGLKYQYLYLKRSISSMVLWKLGAAFKASRLELGSHQIKKFVGLDLLSAHWGDSCGNVACAIGQALGVPATVTYHGSDIHSIPTWRHKRVLANLKFADMNIFVSKFLKAKARELYTELDKANVVYNSVENLFVENSSDLKNENPQQDNISIGFLGALIDLKGIMSLPLIAKHVELISKKTVHVTILGQGVLQGELAKKFRESKISNQFVGMVERSKVKEYIKAMDVLVLPSKREGLGLVLLEAIALGVPAVGSDVGGIVEVVGQDYVVSLGADFESRFAEKLVEVLEKPIQQVIPTEFSQEYTSKQEYQIYSDLLSDKEV